MGRSKTSDFQGTPYFSWQGYRFNYGQEQRSYAKVYRLKGRLEFKERKMRFKEPLILSGNKRSKKLKLA